MKRLLRLDWDAVAGVSAAVIALVLHLLHVVDEGVLLMLALVLLALLFVRDLRGEHVIERMTAGLAATEVVVRDIRAAVRSPDAVLIGPQQLRGESASFMRSARGDLVLFNVCMLMFRSDALFDALLRPAIESEVVTSVRFVLDSAQRAPWEEHLAPKLETCRGREKVPVPHWRSITENVSFIMSEGDPQRGAECLLSFWGEPFMAQVVDHDVPRYIFHVQPHSELVVRLAEIERRYRLAGEAAMS